MYPELRLIKKKKSHKLSIIIMIIFFGLVISYMVVNYFGNKVMPIFMSYAEAETRKLTTLIINKAVTKQMANDMNTDDLFNIMKNDKGEIQLIDFNSVTVNKILTTITALVQLNLKAIEEGNIDLLELPDNTLESYDESLLRRGIIYEIPTGAITGSTFLSNVGPRIPVKLKLVGDVLTGITTDVESYGINNALIKIGVNIQVSSRINLPFISKQITVETTVPISMKIIQGTIPNFYMPGFTQNSGILQSPVE